VDRVFLDSSCFTGDTVVVTGQERRHLADVLRAQPGHRFLATDGEGTEYTLETERTDRQELVARIIDQRTRRPGPGRGLTLAIAPPKGGRMEIAIEKTVECGLGRIVPLDTSRSVLKGRDESARADRWRRVARSATAQAGRYWLTEITAVRTLSEAFQDAVGGRMLLAHPALTSKSIPSAMEAGDPDRVTIFVGPEGGFTDEELAEGEGFGAVPVSLGPTRLRTETAAIVAVSLAMASFIPRA
jgi:16S rRNA (uracil1498-N3)-methyltransferase